MLDMKPRLFFILPLALAFAGSAAAQNLLSNSGFDTGLSGWQAGAGTTWDGTRDAKGSTASGSAHGTAPLPNGGSVILVSQCVNIVHPETSYVLSGKVFIPGGQPTANGVYFTTTPFLDADCSGPIIPGSAGSTPLTTTTNRWTPAAAAVVAYGASARVSALLYAESPGPFQASVDDLRFEPVSASTCVYDEDMLCLHGLRFKVTATFDAGNGNSGAGRMEGLTGDSGYMWFFDEYNVEVIVKVVDGCALGGHYWFFAAGITNVKVVLTVTDLQTGAVKTYTNPADRPFATIEDTAAFACP